MPLARPRLNIITLLGLLLALLAPGRARANDVKDLHYDLKLDLPLLSAGAIAWVGAELFKPRLGPAACRWCVDNGIDARVRSALMWENQAAADKFSNWTAFGALPILSFGSALLLAAAEPTKNGAAINALVIAQAVTFAADLNQLVKFLVGRQRPFVHALPELDRPRTLHPSDNDLSFYSGHTSLAFSLAVAAGTTVTMRGYRAAPYVWAVGMPIAALTGYLRIAADKHYLSDVLVGALIGSAVGYLVPRYMHPARTPDTGAPESSSAPLAFSYAWVQ